MIIIEMIAPSLAEALCRKITADLPEYFGLPEVNEHYAFGVRSRINWAAKVDDEYVGLISIDFPYPKNANIYWIGILRKYDLQNIGKRLSNEAFIYAKDMNAKTISVETLSPQELDENYIKTYNFYESLGFYPLFNLKPESYEWNMVYMMKDLGNFCINKASDASVRLLVKEDIGIITQAFNQIGWNKPASLFEKYLQEHEIGTRQIWIAHIQNQFAGYTTLQLQS